MAAGSRTVSPRTEFKARVLRVSYPAFVKDVDGYWVYWPYGVNRGAYNEAHLECIALLLREANRKWDNEIKEYFETHH